MRVYQFRHLGFKVVRRADFPLHCSESAMLVRQTLLVNGTLQDFKAWTISHRDKT